MGLTVMVLGYESEYLDLNRSAQDTWLKLAEWLRDELDAHHFDFVLDLRPAAGILKIFVDGIQYRQDLMAFFDYIMYAQFPQCRNVILDRLKGLLNGEASPTSV